jgi:UDP-N-acetylmuramoylalanine--D-glutamate ligase
LEALSSTALWYLAPDTIIMNLTGKKILVVGMARSGIAAASFLAARGGTVRITDQRPASELESAIRTLASKGVDCETGGHRRHSFLEAELIVVSPGVPLKIPELVEARQAGHEVISEIELAGRFLQGRVVGITGSNGKTTTTTLIGEILKHAGFHVQVGGNIGVPLISLVEGSRQETVNVVELSSFQLEAIPTFRPAVAVILNVTPDHLDRYDGFDEYAAAKLNLLRNQQEKDHAVLNADDPVLRKQEGRLPASTYWFSLRGPVPQGTFLKGSDLVWREPEREELILSSEQMFLKGRHNLENIAASITAAKLLKATPPRIAEAISSFRGVEHRLERVAEFKGITFYNDSKATNPDATIKALEAFPGGIHLILGGRDKGTDYRALRPLVEGRVKTLFLIGEAAGKIRAHLEGAADLRDAESLEQAVQRAFEQAVPGEIVLLAPACASFDMFQNYEHRGRVFKEAVQRLISTGGQES